MPKVEQVRAQLCTTCGGRVINVKRYCEAITGTNQGKLDRDYDRHEDHLPMDVDLVDNGCSRSPVA